MYKINNSLIKGLNILESFTPARPRLTLQEIIKSTGLPKPTAYRFLHTLVEFNYISFDQESRKYFLTPKVMSLGYAILSGLPLREAALPYLDELSRETDGNISLGILEGNEVVFVARIAKKRIVNIDLFVGSRVNVYQTAVGRAILAFLNEEKQQKVFKGLLHDRTAIEVIGPKGENLFKILSEVRQKGFAFNNEEFIPGVRAISAPIFDSKGDVEGAVNISVFSHIVSLDELIERYVPLLVETAQKISETRRIGS